MGLKGHLEAGAAEVAKGARSALASSPAQRAGEGFRSFRELVADEERPLSVERCLLMLVAAVRNDEASQGQTRGDLVSAARKRRRRLGLMSFGAGPLVGVANQLADLYCETATLCEIASLHDLRLSDEQIGAHMLVIWEIADSYPSACRAMGGDPPIASILAGMLHEGAGRQLPERLTKRSAITALWNVRDTVGEIRKGATTSAVRSVAFTGHRTKKIVKKAEMQLGVRQAGH